jgi:hypothetical protein
LKFCFFFVLEIFHGGPKHDKGASVLVWFQFQPWTSLLGHDIEAKIFLKTLKVIEMNNLTQNKLQKQEQIED